MEATNHPLGLFEKWLLERGISVNYFKEDMSQIGKDALYSLFKLEQKKELEKGHSSNPGELLSRKELQELKETFTYEIVLNKGFLNELTVTIPAKNDAQASWLARKKFTEERKLLPTTLEIFSKR